MAGVYLSYPFCQQKCTYCNFASGVLPADLEPRYVAALEREIRGHTWEWVPETVYLGGGTPSRMSVGALARVLRCDPGTSVGGSDDGSGAGRDYGGVGAGVARRGDHAGESGRAVVRGGGTADDGAAAHGGRGGAGGRGAA